MFLGLTENVCICFDGLMDEKKRSLYTVSCTGDTGYVQVRAVLLLLKKTEVAVRYIRNTVLSLALALALP